MSVENKIKELLGRAGDKEQVLTEESKEDLTSDGMADTGAKASMNMSKDSSKAAKAATAGHTTQPKQGSSQDASYTENDEDTENLGAKAAACLLGAFSPVENEVLSARAVSSLAVLRTRASNASGVSPCFGCNVDLK